MGDSYNILSFVEHSSARVDIARLEQLLQHILQDLRPNSTGELRCIFAGHDLVTSLNSQYLQHDYDTDVLTFNLSDSSEGPLDAEIYIDVETALERQADLGIEVERELIRYAIHGILHVLGYDDSDEKGKSEMSSKEDYYLELWQLDS